MACATLKRSWEFDPVHSPGRPNKRPRCTPMCVSPTSSSPPPAKKSCFDVPKMTPDEMAACIRDEMERRKKNGGQAQSQMNMSPSHSSEGSNSDSEVMPMSPDPHSDQRSLEDRLRKKSLFTYKQVLRICARVVKEREDQLKQDYEEILNNKLSEQYETFVRFSRDQIQRHFSPDSTPSYLS